MNISDFLYDLTFTARGIMMYKLIFKNSCFWSREKLELYQYTKLKRLLIECNKNVPYYKNLFNSIKFDPAKDFKSLTDLSYIPILTKEKAKEVRPFLDNIKYKGKAIKLRTSGSTGEPFEVYVSRNAWIVEQAAVWRHWIWNGYKFRDPMAMVRSYLPKHNQKLFKYDFFKNTYMFSPFHLSDNTIGEYLDIMIEKKISVLRGYPSSIFTIAEYIQRTNHEIPKLKLILTASETLRESERLIIETAFKAKISNHYGLAEVVVMMGNCNSTSGMHNYDDYGYLELVDTDNSNLKRIIGTNLHNLATPLIRYDTGDIAEMADQTSVCDHSFLTIHNIIGRKDQQILTPEGYKIPTINFYTCFEYFQQISRWQIIQRNINTIEILIRLKGGVSISDHELKLELYKRLPESMSIIIHRNHQFVQGTQGKINAFVSYI